MGVAHGGEREIETCGMLRHIGKRCHRMRRTWFLDGDQRVVEALLEAAEAVPARDSYSWCRDEGCARHSLDLEGGTGELAVNERKGHLPWSARTYFVR